MAMYEMQSAEGNKDAKRETISAFNKEVTRLGLGLGLGLCCEYFGSAIGQLGTATD